MDHPDIMSQQHTDSWAVAAFSSERDYSNAVCDAVQLHCQGKRVPEDIARFCRTIAVNLDRDLARSKGETLPPIPKEIDDYTICDTQSNFIPDITSSNARPATEIGMDFPTIMTKP